MQIEQLGGGKTQITDTAFHALRTAFRGNLIVPGDDAFNEARKVWNGMIDRRPGLIAQCAGTADVIAAVNFARTHELLVAVRGGGHSWPGHSVCDDGLMIDLSRMRGVRVDLRTKTVHAQGGALWGDVDHESQAFGLATSGGVVSTTGIGGLTLGGGSQTWLIRKYGSSADNLVSADVVTANGDFLAASEREHEDLFWALRGGGGNFGVVTSFQFRLHPVGPLVLAGPAFFLWDRVKEVTDFYLDYVKDLPDELTSALFYWSAPPAPFLPESIHGQRIAIIAVCYAGAAAAGEAVVAPIRALKPAVDMLAPLPYAGLQSLFDPLFPKGIYSYSKSDYFDKIPPAMVDDMIAWAEPKPAPLSLTHLNHFGGAMGRVPNDRTPFAHRDATFAFSQDGFWDKPESTEANVQWVKGCWQAMRSYSPRGAYVNFMADEGEDRVQESYGGNHERLVQIKRKYDPGNLFRLNQNIRP
ncbi:MAG: FAD-binding oxidoreductase [Vicinamibacterales bacterium]